MRGPQPQTVVLQHEHLEILQHNLRSGTTEHRVARRSQILLWRHEVLRPTQIAQRLGCGRNTVWRVSNRYRQKGLEALQDLPRPGHGRFFPLATRPNGRLGLSRTG